MPIPGGSEGIEVLSAVTRLGPHAVGVDFILDNRIIHRPHGGAVTPDCLIVGPPSGVEGIEVLGAVTRLGPHAVGVDFGISPIHHPHGGAVAPDAFRIPIPGGYQGIEVLESVPGRGQWFPILWRWRRWRC